MDNSEKVLNFIEEYIDKNDYPPTVREICAGLGFTSTSSAQYYLKKLERNGSLTLAGSKKRSIKLAEGRSVSRLVPEVGVVTAGTPILAVENLVGYSQIPQEFGSPNELFMLRVSGSSMIEAGIMDGDKIIVRKTPVCEDGEIVVALIDDSATCKRFFRRNGKIVLHPENPDFDDIILDSVQILGTVKGLIRKF